MGTITVSNLGKAYKQYPTRWSRLAEWISPGHKPRHSLKWVLQDVSFTVQPGEAVGIIGINGAGKSTLLKMITGTTQPTTGGVHISGRVAALLELGMGFHPDFTGRQNAFMAGQLLGYSVEEIARLMPEIEAFAEIGDYIDQPVRVYSSGMQMRLAFSIATAIRPDVLIVDEALSVGDAYFVHKSFGRIREFREQGTTLLIVSHDKHAIQAICDRAILLNAGRVAMVGEPEAVMDYYNALIADHQDQEIKQVVMDDGKVQTVSGTGEATIKEIYLQDAQGEKLDIVFAGQQVTLKVLVSVKSDIALLVLGYGIKDRLGQPVFGTNTWHTGKLVRNLSGGDCVEYAISFVANLGAGTYSIFAALTDSDTHLTKNYEWIDLAFAFTVINSNYPIFVGSVWFDHEMEVKCFPGSALASNNTPDKKILIATTDYGEMLVYEGDSVIGASLVGAGSFQEEKIAQVTSFLNTRHAFSPKIFVDVGANIGTHTVYALKKLGIQSAICFEPEPDNFELLLLNTARNNLSDRVELNRVALSDRTGDYEMELSNTNYGDHRIKASATHLSFGEENERRCVSVPFITLDDYAAKNDADWHDALLWMDTQGHEGHVFSGGSQFFSSASSPGYVVSEFWPYGIERAVGFDKYFDFLRRCKRIYDINAMENGGFKPVTIEILKSMYHDMLSRTEKENHPHTDLLLILQGSSNLKE